MAGEARKTVTVVFTDVTGSTDLGEQLDPEALRAVMERYFQTAQTVLEHHGGTVEKFIGDAVMAVFGIPAVHEDDALRAVRAAVELRDELGRLNDELEQERGVRIAVRTGVNTGEVIVGDPAARQFYATGDAVNVAARLEQAADPGEILLGDTTRRLVRDAVEFEPVGELELKGKADVVGAWRLRRLHPDAVMVARRLETPLVGRRDELEALVAAYEQARDKRCARLCTIVGAPGVGKSRLAAELTAHVAAEATVLTGRCLSYGEGLTYWPLVEIVRQAGEHFPLREIVPERPLGVVAGLIGEDETTATAEEAFWAVRKLFDALAAERPLTVVVDDIHWAEPTLLDLLEHVLEFSTDAPLLLVALARPEFLDARPLWASRREDMSLVRLEPLGPEESDQLLDALGSDIPEDARQRIETAAGGNPLFIEQMLAMLAEDRRENGDVLVPPTVQALLAARIDELPPDERAVVEPAAVVGHEFWREAVVALCPDVPVSASLQRLARKDLVGKVRSSFVAEDAFRFRHILIRDAAYAGIPKSRRADLHERFADWLEEMTPEFEEIVGYHLEQAVRYLGELGPAGERQRELGRRASERLSSAGGRAWQRADAAAATSLLERALVLLPDGERPPTELVVALGVALETVGRLEDAAALLADAAREAAAAGQRADEMRFLIESALVRFAHSEPIEDIEPLLEEALETFTQAGDDAGLAAAWHLASYPAWIGLRWQEVVVAMERALEHGRRAGDHARAERSANWLMMAYAWGPIPVEQAKGRLEDLIRAFEPGGTLEASGLTFLAEFAAMAGDFERARALYCAGIERISEAGALLRRAGRTVIGGDIEVLAGDAAAAEAELRTGFDIFENVGETGILSTVAFNLAEAIYRQGRFDEAEEIARRSADVATAEDVSSQVGWRRVLAKILAQSGDFDAADRLSGEAVALIGKTDSLFEQAITLVDRAEVLRLAGRKEEAAQALDEALRLYEAKGVVPAIAETRGLLAELTR